MEFKRSINSKDDILERHLTQVNRNFGANFTFGGKWKTIGCNHESKPNQDDKPAMRPTEEPKVNIVQDVVENR